LWGVLEGDVVGSPAGTLFRRPFPLFSNRPRL
jgi:hypothetical protein